MLSLVSVLSVSIDSAMVSVVSNKRTSLLHESNELVHWLHTTQSAHAM
jgi:hypothetical protein